MTQPVVTAYKGIPHSIEVVIAGIRTDRNDRDLHRWAIDALAASGCDGRSRTCSVRDQAQILLDALRAQTIYVPDPVGSEYNQASHVTLCLRDRCIPAEDCDGLLRVLASALLSIGISAYMVVQEFGPDVQPHTLIGILDEAGNEYYADPANTTSPVYSGSRAMREEWIDPMSAERGFRGPEMVTLAGVPREVGRVQGLWVEKRYGKAWVYRNRVWSELPRAESSGTGLGDVGSFIFWHSAHELSDLLNALTYQVGQITNAFNSAKAQWQANDSAGQQAWATQYQSALTAWTPIATECATFVQAIRMQAAGNVLAADWDWAPAISNTGIDLFDALAKAFMPFEDLDRELRRSRTYPGPLPTYPDTPQPTAPDFSLAAYQVADSWKQKIEQFGAKTQSFMEKAAPWIAVTAVGLGIYAVYKIGSGAVRAVR